MQDFFKIMQFSKFYFLPSHFSTLPSIKWKENYFFFQFFHFIPSTPKGKFIFCIILFFYSFNFPLQFNTTKQNLNAANFKFFIVGTFHIHFTVDIRGSWLPLPIMSSSKFESASSLESAMCLTIVPNTCANFKL